MQDKVEQPTLRNSDDKHVKSVNILLRGKVRLLEKTEKLDYTVLVFESNVQRAFLKIDVTKETGDTYFVGKFYNLTVTE